jgi:hypothetical protein
MGWGMALKEELRDISYKILENAPNGLRWMELLRAIKAEKPGLGPNFHTSVFDLYKREPEVFYKPERGLWKLVKFRDAASESATEVEPTKEKSGVLEKDFYEVFASFLEGELEDVTKAIPLGGSRFKGKWGTPDVIGKRESRPSDIIKVPTEIVSAEIKTDTSQLITAFGQACAYCLFSHKSYLVIPKASSSDDLGRLDALCQIFGIGLILFNANSPEQPEFEVRVRARRCEPDMYYVNENLKNIETELFS